MQIWERNFYGKKLLDSLFTFYLVLLDYISSDGYAWLIVLILTSTMSTWQSRTTGQQQRTGRTDNIDGAVLDILGDRQATLEWEQRVGNVEILPGGTNYSILSDFKGSIVRLWEDFFSGKNSIQLEADKKEQLQKRLMLLEHEVDGLLRRRITFSVKDGQGGHRSLDYTGLLNEK